VSQYPLDRILKIDQTNWRVVAARFSAWAPAGAETVNCHIAYSENQEVTAIAAITAAGEKLPRTLIGKGKTNRCLQAYRLPDDVWSFVSESRWTTAEIMVQYLTRLRNSPTFLQGPLIVLLDTYAARRCARVREAAQRLEIDLVFIPPGSTDTL
jgi:hypothetical protein